ncbi:uncharacterized protein LOC142819091 isoform X2 [Pelodiscus sinensis]|uniref:uncharacterized protein LOC142819091 isoform X2 n=1 Tax=Pelodiscus sinensis TaxID=13735 RepID=UPI003F6C0748
MLQQRHGNQVWGLPRGARCPSAWAPSQGRCRPPWPVAHRKRAHRLGRPGMPASPKAKAAGGSSASGPKDKEAGGADPKMAGGNVVGPTVMAANGSGVMMGAAPTPTAKAAGGSVMTAPASGPPAKAAGGSVMTAPASGPPAKAAGGSVMTVPDLGPTVKAVGGSVIMVPDPGPMVKVAGGSVEEPMVLALGLMAKVAERSTAAMTVKLASEALTVMPTAATSCPVGKPTTVTSGPATVLAASRPLAMGPLAKLANETIQSTSFGSQEATLLPKVNSGILVSTVKSNSSSMLAFKDPLASIATKRQSNNNVPMCGTPSAKHLKLPGPDDNHSPALLEAFKAVIAAGGSSWLDPAAVAAVRTELQVECSLEEDLGSGSRDTSAKSSEPEQLTWTPTLLVTKRKRKKKPISQERTTFVTLVPCTENRIKEPKPNSLRSQDQAEACNVKPILSFFPPESPIKSMVPGGGYFMQAEPKEIWICGHSVILVTKRRASTHPHGLQLGYPSSSAFLYWHGIQAMLWDQLLPLLHEIYCLRSFPSIIVIHLGENDLMQHSSMSLVVKMKNDLGILRRAFPDTYIIWSSLLPRRFWKGAEKPQHPTQQKAWEFACHMALLLKRHRMKSLEE